MKKHNILQISVNTYFSYTHAEVNIIWGIDGFLGGHQFNIIFGCNILKKLLLRKWERR